MMVKEVVKNTHTKESIIENLIRAEMASKVTLDADDFIALLSIAHMFYELVDVHRNSRENELTHYNFWEAIEKIENILFEDIDQFIDNPLVKHFQIEVKNDDK